MPTEQSPAIRARTRGRPTSIADCLTIADIGALARGELPEPVWDFVSGGSGRETTLTANLAAWNRIDLIPRVLAGVGEADPSGHLAGTEAALPVVVAPMAYQRLVHPYGELALAEAACAAGVPFTITTLSSHPTATIAKAGARNWFQLYWLRDRNLMSELVGEAEAAGCRALMVTVDTPRMARRHRDIRNGFALPADVRPANLARHLDHGGAATLGHRAVAGVSALAEHTAELFKPDPSWADLEWLRGRSTLPLIVKGVLDPRDATAAVGRGANAIVVSNHGGRQLDGAITAVAALPAIRAAVDGRCEVFVDGGIRSGTDILRALALGASGVLIGRPLLWGLAAGGLSGAAKVLQLLATELREAMALAGCADLRDAAALEWSHG